MKTIKLNSTELSNLKRIFRSSHNNAVSNISTFEQDHGVTWSNGSYICKTTGKKVKFIFK